MDTSTAQHITAPGLTSTLQTSQETQLSAHAFLNALDDLLTSASGNGDPFTPEQRAELGAQFQQFECELARLRLLNRSAVVGARETKGQTAEARQEVDRLHLQLQNLYYEQRHLQGEIEACNSYDHSYQQLPLISQDEFLALFPEHAESDEDTLMAARIEHERAEREALEQERQELLKRKLKLTSDNKKRANDLANLDVNLEKFIDAAKPIQKLFENVV